MRRCCAPPPATRPAPAACWRDGRPTRRAERQGAVGRRAGRRQCRAAGPPAPWSHCPVTDPASPAATSVPAQALPRHWLGPALAVALGYFLTGELGLLLAIPPGYASPLYPSAGLALAATLVYGRHALPGVLLGSFLVNLTLTKPGVPFSWLTLLLPLVSALGATLQAALGTALVRRWQPSPLVLAEPREVAGFFMLGGVLACCLNASLSTLALSLSGSVPAGSRAFTWWTWWAGDTLGVLIGAPVVLTLIGRPRSAWVARRVTLGLPLLATTLLLALATVLVSRWDGERTRSVFERDAAAAGAALSAELRQSLFALEALHGLYIASNDVTADEMRLAMQPWLKLPIHLQAMGYSERIARAALPRRQTELAQRLGRPYRIFDRQDGGAPSLAAADDEVVAIALIEPLESNQRALGVNALSIAAPREAILRAVATGEPAASTGFLLTQESERQTGVVIYRALRDDGGGSDGARRAAWRGVVFVSLRMQRSVQAAMARAPSYLRWCLVDSNPAAAQRLLAGESGCDAASGRTLRHQTTIALGGQRWVLHVVAEPARVPDAGHGNAWLFSTVGLLSAAMLAALLLTVTGRTRRIEAAVDERTADLRREVAERQRTESALRESEQRFRNIFDQAPIGIVYADLQGRVRESNPRLRELLGHAGDALADRSLEELTYPDDRAEDRQALGRLLRGELPEVQRSTRLQHRDGQWLRVRINWRVLRNLAGEPQRLVAVVEDITEQLRRQEAEQGRQLAESANRAKSEFLSRMSHELRTPLNAMLGFAQLLDLDRQPRLSGHQQGWVGQILQAGWHLLEMINDTLDLSRIEAGMLRLTLVPVALDPLVAHCMAMVSPAAAQRGITLATHIAADAALAVGDETRLKQVLTNLLSNAVKYNVAGGRVEVSTRRLDAQMLEVRVLDTGLGLDPAQMAELFQPFNRLGREQGDTEGTGIGLVISRRLAELMGGTLEAESVPGEGATFLLRLPLATLPLPHPGAAEMQADTAERYRHRSVHYVEDNETNVEVMRGILAQRPQVTLTVSALGLDGLQAIRQHRPDLILLDMQLPDVDGLELLRQLQRDPACADIPVVVVSADATPARVAEALAAGARHYLTKPLNLAGFLAVLDDLLESIDTRFG
ncbi:MAG: CHASE domain-containing protein [Burkholderiaceae bacterium]|nr:CHASE domain-containing protein [Burkholderiaceae bacterium]